MPLPSKWFKNNNKEEIIDPSLPSEIKPILYHFDEYQTYDLLWLDRPDNRIMKLFPDYQETFYSTNNIIMSVLIGNPVLIERYYPYQYIPHAHNYGLKLFNSFKKYASTGTCEPFPYLTSNDKFKYDQQTTTSMQIDKQYIDQYPNNLGNPFYPIKIIEASVLNGAYYDKDWIRPSKNNELPLPYVVCTTQLIVPSANQLGASLGEKLTITYLGHDENSEVKEYGFRVINVTIQSEPVIVDLNGVQPFSVVISGNYSTNVAIANDSNLFYANIDNGLVNIVTWVDLKLPDIGKILFSWDVSIELTLNNPDNPNISFYSTSPFVYSNYQKINLPEQYKYYVYIFANNNKWGNFTEVTTQDLINGNLYYDKTLDKWSFYPIKVKWFPSLNEDNILGYQAYYDMAFGVHNYIVDGQGIIDGYPFPFSPTGLKPTEDIFFNNFSNFIVLDNYTYTDQYDPGNDLEFNFGNQGTSIWYKLLMPINWTSNPLSYPANNLGVSLGENVYFSHVLYPTFIILDKIAIVQQMTPNFQGNFRGQNGKMMELFKTYCSEELYLGQYSITQISASTPSGNTMGKYEFVDIRILLSRDPSTNNWTNIALSQQYNWFTEMGSWLNPSNFIFSGNSGNSLVGANNFTPGWVVSKTIHRVWNDDNQSLPIDTNLMFMDIANIINRIDQAYYSEYYLNNGEYQTTMPDSVRVKEIHAALQASKFSQSDNDPDVPRVANLGYYIERIGRVLGISVNSDGTIRSIRNSIRIEQDQVIPSGYNFGQFGLHTAGKNNIAEGQIGGESSHIKDGIVYEVKSNILVKDTLGKPTIKSGGYVLCENIPQFLHILMQDLDKALGLQELGAFPLPTPDNKNYVTYEGLHSLIADLTFMISKLSDNIIQSHVLGLKNNALLLETLRATGLAISEKRIKIKIDDQDAQIVTPAISENSLTITDFLFKILENLSLIVGSQVTPTIEKKK